MSSSRSIPLIDIDVCDLVHVHPQYSLKLSSSCNLSISYDETALAFKLRESLQVSRMPNIKDLWTSRGRRLSILFTLDIDGMNLKKNNVEDFVEQLGSYLRSSQFWSQLGLRVALTVAGSELGSSETMRKFQLDVFHEDHYITHPAKSPSPSISSIRPPAGIPCATLLQVRIVYKISKEPFIRTSKTPPQLIQNYISHNPSNRNSLPTDQGINQNFTSSSQPNPSTRSLWPSVAKQDGPNPQPMLLSHHMDMLDHDESDNDMLLDDPQEESSPLPRPQTQSFRPFPIETFPIQPNIQILTSSSPRSMLDDVDYPQHVSLPDSHPEKDINSLITPAGRQVQHESLPSNEQAVMKTRIGLKSDPLATTGLENQTLDNSTKLFCICRRPEGDAWVIACDGGCNDWYHGTCVNINENDVDFIDRYICPNCEENGLGWTTWKPMCHVEACQEPANVIPPEQSNAYCDQHKQQHTIKDGLASKGRVKKRKIKNSFTKKRRKGNLKSTSSDIAEGQKQNHDAGGDEAIPHDKLLCMKGKATVASGFSVLEECKELAKEACNPESHKPSVIPYLLKDTTALTSSFQLTSSLASNEQSSLDVEMLDDIVDDILPEYLTCSPQTALFASRSLSHSLTLSNENLGRTVMSGRESPGTKIDDMLEECEEEQCSVVMPIIHTGHGTLTTNIRQKQSGKLINILEGPNSGMEAECEMAASKSLFEIALRQMMCTELIQLLPGVTCEKNPPGPRLADIAPALFSPGYLDAMAKNNQFLTSISKSMVSIYRYTKSQSLITIFTQLREIFAVSPDVSDVYEEHRDTSTQGLLESLKGRLWKVAQEMLYDAKAAGRLKPIEPTDEAAIPTAGWGMLDNGSLGVPSRAPDLDVMEIDHDSFSEGFSDLEDEDFCDELLDDCHFAAHHAPPMLIAQSLSGSA